MRLDIYLVEEGYFESRARAREAILAGLVRIDDAVAAKPAQKIAAGAAVTVTGEVHPYVSRGGIKLDAALRQFQIDPKGKVCLDLGASTGGFTDVLLRGGADRVYAADVGRGQLHEKIAGEPRVINLEKTHAKDLSPALIPDPIDLIVCDVSFISLKKALPPALLLAAPGARLAALVKPQFEVGPDQIGKGGLVKPGFKNGEGIANDIAAWLGDSFGWTSIRVMESPIPGGDGNREFLLGAVRDK